MFPSSRPQQHTHRTQFPSTIRTRSQLGHPLAPVDLYASPLKKAIRDHSRSTDKTNDELETENTVLHDAISTDNDIPHRTVLSPSHSKRASSPSFDRIDNSGKRRKVLAQSSKANSLFLRHSEAEYLGNGLLLGHGSPLTPPPPTSHPNGSTLSLKPSIPLSISGQAVTPTGRPSIPSTSSGIPQNSPSKSRIPVPSSASLSRIPRQSSFSKSTLPVAGPSSPIKAPTSPSPLKPKTRPKGKVKPGARSRAPLTRLAAKRRLRTSSSLTGLRTTASAGTNAPVLSSDSAGTSNVAATCVRPPTERKSLVTSSLLSSENTPIQASSSGRLPSSSSSGSPKKPTPLTALSTALQKLRATPPAAPLPRARPNTSLGFTRPSLIPPQTPTLPAFNTQDDGHLDINTPGSSKQSSAVLQRSKTLGHSQLNKPNPAVGKIGLPLRRPSTANSNGRSAPWAGPPFASKQTTLSTVPASPCRSAAPAEAARSSSTQDTAAETLDVDAWVPSNRNNKGKEEIESRTQEVEYFVSLIDEPHAKQQPLPELVSPSRRASQASLLLSQSLSHPREPIVRPPARSASTSTVVQPIPRTPVKTRGRARPLPPVPQPGSEGGGVAKPDDPMGGKRSNARMPGSLDVLKDCIIFVDVRTEEGEDAAALFVDMLRGLGARILAKPGKSCTHLVYKAGLPSTISKYKLLPEPRPLPVSIGWVVECVEKRAHMDETRFLVNLNEIGVAGGNQRRRSMQPKQMRTLTLGRLDNGEPADISVRADSSFTSEEQPSTSGLILANLSPLARSPNDSLPPLERARQRSLRLPRE